MVQPGKSPFVFSRRQEVDTASSGAKSVYGQQVSGMNSFLDRRGIDISERSKVSVIDNVKQVESGARSEVNAHQRECVGFMRDSVESFSQRQYRQGAVELTGSVMNGLGSLFKSTYTPTPLEKRGVDPY